MSIPAVSSVNTAPAPKKSGPNYVKWTGYGALGFGVASAVAGSKKKIKPHKYMAYIAGILAVAHTGLVEWHHFQRKKAAK